MKSSSPCSSFLELSGTSAEVREIRGLANAESPVPVAARAAPALGVMRQPKRSNGPTIVCIATPARELSVGASVENIRELPPQRCLRARRRVHRDHPALLSDCKGVYRRAPGCDRRARACRAPRRAGRCVRAWPENENPASYRSPHCARHTCSRTDGRVRLSCGSVESHTAQWHPSVGTPIEVPDPSTVNCRRGHSKWDDRRK